MGMRPVSVSATVSMAARAKPSETETPICAGAEGGGDAIHAGCLRP